MPSRTEVVLAGLAGQGLVFAGGILADAAGLRENRFVSQMAFFGTAARTGPSRSEVIVGDEEIDFPAVTRPDIVVALTQADARSFASRMRPGGTLIVDSSQDHSGLPQTLSVCGVPLLSIAKEISGEEVSVSLVALGALAAISDVVGLASLEQTVTSRFPGPTGERNLALLREGYKAGQQAQPVHPQPGLGA